MGLRVLGGLLVSLAVAAAVGLFALAFTTSGGFDNETVPLPESSTDVRPDTDYYLYLSRSASDLAEGGCTLTDAASGEELPVAVADDEPRRKFRSVRVVARGTFHTESDRLVVDCEEYAAVGPRYDPDLSRVLDAATLVVPALIAAPGLWLVFGRRKIAEPGNNR